jgi:hypothetical protein
MDLSHIEPLLALIDSRPSGDGHALRFSALYQEVAAVFSHYPVRLYDGRKYMLSTITVGLIAVLRRARGPARVGLIRSFLSHVVNTLTMDLPEFPSIGFFELVRTWARGESNHSGVARVLSFPDAQLWVRDHFTEEHDDYLQVLSVIFWAWAIPSWAEERDAEMIALVDEIRRIQRMEVHDAAGGIVSMYDTPDEVATLFHF